MLLASNFRTGRPIVLLLLFFLLSSKTEALPKVLGNREQGYLFHEKQGNKCVKNEGNRVIKAILGEQGNKNQDFDKQRNKAIFFWRTREQVPSPHPVTYDLGIMQ